MDLASDDTYLVVGANFASTKTDAGLVKIVSYNGTIAKAV